MRRRIEASHQEAFFQWLRLYPWIDELTWHTPNGGARTKAGGAALRRQGVKPGVPDIYVAIPNDGYHGYFIELKSKGAKTTEHQDKMHVNLERNGYKVDICYSWTEAKDNLLAYLRGTEHVRLRSIS